MNYQKKLIVSYKELMTLEKLADEEGPIEYLQKDFDSFQVDVENTVISEFMDLQLV